MKKNRNYLLITVTIITIVALLLFLVSSETNKLSLSATNSPTYTRKELQDYIVSTALSYYYKNTYTDYEGTFRDNAYSEWPTTYNVSPEMLSRSKFMTSQCEAFTVTCYLYAFNYDFSKYLNSFYYNKYMSYVAKEGSTYKRYFVHDSKSNLITARDYFAKGYSVTVMNNIARDLAKGLYPNDDTLVLTYQKGVITKGISGISDTSKSVTELISGTNGNSILNEIVSKLQPGDIILNNGHAMLYVGNIFEDGGGVIHSTGNSLSFDGDSFNAGYDSFDVRYTSMSKIKETGIKYHGSKENTIISILRPINSMCSFDSSGNCTLYSSYAKIVNNTIPRNKLNALRVEQYIYDITSDRTISADSISANIGDEISYNISLTNKSNFNYCSSGNKTNKTDCVDSGYEWKTSKYKKDYNNITIKASIPKNTTFVKCNNNCEYSNGNIVWKNVSSLSSNTNAKVYTYQVRINVNNSIKSIENSGASIIYSGSTLKMGKIVTHVNSSITGVYSKEFRDIINDYVSKNKTCTSSLNNAIDIYDEFLNSTNKTIENKNTLLKNVITADNIVSGLFNKNGVPNEHTLEGISSSATTKLKCSSSSSACEAYTSYTKKLNSETSSLTGSKKAINQMLVPGLYGGKLYEKLYIKDKMSELDRIKIIWHSYRNFNVGDIIVTLKKNGSSFNITNAIVYDGLDDSGDKTYEPIYVYCYNEKIKKHIIEKKYNGTTETWYSSRYLLHQIYTSDLYVVLRPSLYYKPVTNKEIAIKSSYITSSNCPTGWTYASKESYNECRKNINYYYNATYNDYGFSSLPKLTRKGYSHSGWKIYTYNSKTEKYDISTKITGTSIYKSGYALYPEWTNNTYKITLDYQGGKGNVTQIYEKYNTGWFSDSSAKKSISSISIPTKEGYTFKGYWTKNDGTGTQIISSSGKINSNKYTTFADDNIIYAYFVLNDSKDDNPEKDEPIIEEDPITDDDPAIGKADESKEEDKKVDDKKIEEKKQEDTEVEKDESKGKTDKTINEDSTHDDEEKSEDNKEDIPSSESEESKININAEQIIMIVCLVVIAIEVIILIKKNKKHLK